MRRLRLTVYNAGAGAPVMTNDARESCPIGHLSDVWEFERRHASVPDDATWSWQQRDSDWYADRVANILGVIKSMRWREQPGRMLA